MKLKHFISSEQLSKEMVYALVKRALELKADSSSVMLSDMMVVNCFFENSTRTQTSFEVAERKCGMTVIPFNPQTSSLSKGETLFDTVLTMDALGIEIAVIRSSEEQYYEALIQSSDLSISIINGGDGTGHHPTQCLLDMVTIYECFGRFEGLNVVIVGDIKHSRVAHSNAALLSKLGAHVSFCGPEVWMDEAMNALGPLCCLDAVIESVDVVMLLRVQHERHPEFVVEAYHQKYGLTKELADRMKASAIIMHPAPVNRGVEIDSDLVISKHSRIVAQMRNGVYARMTILEAVGKGRTQ